MTGRVAPLRLKQHGLQRSTATTEIGQPEQLLYSHSSTPLRVQLCLNIRACAKVSLYSFVWVGACVCLCVYVCFRRNLLKLRPFLSPFVPSMLRIGDMGGRMKRSTKWTPGSPVTRTCPMASTEFAGFTIYVTILPVYAKSPSKVRRVCSFTEGRRKEK